MRTYGINSLNYYSSLLFSCISALLSLEEPASAAVGSEKVGHSIAISEKLKAMEKCKEGMSPTVITGEFIQPLSSVSTIIKDGQRISEATLGTVNSR